MERKFMQFAVGLNLMLMSASSFAYSALTIAPGANQSNITVQANDTATIGLSPAGELAANPRNAYGSDQRMDSNSVVAAESQNIHYAKPVQLPAPAAVWLFLTGFFGLLYLNRRH